MSEDTIAGYSPTKIASRGAAVLTRRARPRNLIVLGLVIAVTVALSIASPAFLSTGNLLTLADQNAAIMVITMGMTVVIIGGGFDLSVGAVFGLCGLITALLANAGYVAVAIPAAVLCGVALGAVNGLLVTLGRTNTLIATLATGMIFTGVIVLATDGHLVSVSSPALFTLGNGSVGGVSYATLVAVAVIAVLAVVLARTSFGRYVYAVGGNAEAARLAGVRADLVRAATFVISGLTAGIAGILAVSRVAEVQPDSGTGLELTAIAAVVIGGTSVAGGEGAVWRSVVGVALLALIENGFALVNIDTRVQHIAEGAMILTAVVADAYARRHRS